MMISITRDQTNPHKTFSITDIMPEEIMAGVSPPFFRGRDYYMFLEELVDIWIRNGRNGETVPQAGIQNDSDRAFIERLQTIVDEIR